MRRFFVALLFLLSAPIYSQQDKAEPLSGVVSLEASATAQVPTDWAVLTLAVERQESEAEAVVDEVNRVLAGALREARAYSSIAAHSGNYHTYPVTDRDQRIVGWRARAQIVLEGKNFQDLSRLAGKLAPRMQVSSMSFDLSPGTRRREEEKLIEAAVSAFKEKAQTAARAFGYSRYTLRQAVIASGSGALPPRPLLAAGMQAERHGGPVPVEGGQATVTVSVSGSVQLER